MKCPCEVLFHSSSKWQAAILTTEHPNGIGLPLIEFEGNTYSPRNVEVVRISAAADCPLELFDVAVNAGFYILGTPGKATYSAEEETTPRPLKIENVFITAWMGLRKKFADDQTKQLWMVENYKRRMREAKTEVQARGVIAELCAVGGIAVGGIEELATEARFAEFWKRLKTDWRECRDLCLLASTLDKAPAPYCISCHAKEGLDHKLEVRKDEPLFLCSTCWNKVARGGRTPEQTIEAVLYYHNDPRVGGPDDPLDHEDYRDVELLGLKDD
ncbi:MAG: hypothetical protein JXB10_01460 [Pirellulales bacterium]|nr:hypothetical protein [Pirellulales bacterium]